MMQVVLDTERVGRQGVQRIGDTISVDDDEAKRLVESGQAHIETTVQEQKREKAVARVAHRGR